MTSKSQIVGALTRTMSYTYNAAGQLATVTTPSGRQVVYTFANNRPVSVTVDNTNVLNSAVYEPFGPIGGWYWGNSAPPVINTHTRLFDRDFRTTRVTSDLPTTGSQPVFDKQLTWDDQSRVQGLSDLANSALNATYGFDTLDRLASTTQGASSWGYTYNGTGDRITSTVNSAITNYGYAAASHKLQALTGAQTRTYSLDAAGNMTSDGTTTWSYGGNNRATQAGSTTFLVNALGQRVKKASASAITHFVFDEAGRLWGEYDATGNLIQETIWLDDLPVATYTGALNYVHPDHLATPRAITRASDNALVWRWDNTEAFGNSQPDSNPSGLGAFTYNLRFPGQYFDAETGTHYNYYRDYDPAIGRYIESDPIGLRGGISTYAYVRSRPLNLIDRLGLRAQMCCKMIVPGFAHCFINEEQDKDKCENGNCTSKTRRIGLQGPWPLGSSSNGAGEIHINDNFDQPGESKCGDWASYCGLSRCLDQVKDDYPSRSEYSALSGPNSNTFATHLGNMCSIPFASGPHSAPGWGQPPAGPAK